MPSSERFVTGSVWMGDFRTVYPAQSTPPLVVTDRMIFTDPSSMGARSMRYIPEVGGAMAPELLVPHNNKITDPAMLSSVKDGDEYLLADAPSVEWKKFTFSDGTNAVLTNYADTSGWGHQVIDVNCKSASAAPDFGFTASTKNLASQQVQGFSLKFQRRLAANSDGAIDHWRIEFQLSNWLTYRINFSTQKGVSISVRNEKNRTTAVPDPDGGTHNLVELGVVDEYGDVVFGGSKFLYPDSEYIDISQDVEANGEESEVLGVKSRAFGTELTTVKVLMVANRILVWVGGFSKPFVFHHFRNRSSKNWLVNYVTVDALNVSQCSFSLHPVRFVADTGYRSSPQQLGFVPVNPFGFIFSIHDAVSRVYASGEAATIDAPFGGTLTGTILDGQTLATVVQYDLDLALNSNASWQGVDYANTSPILTKVQLKTEGSVSPSSGSGLVSFNSLTPPSNIRPRMITEESEADFEGMTIRQSVSMTYTYFNGLDVLTAQTGGMAGIGNIAVGLKLGATGRYDDGVTVASVGSDGQPFWRFQGMCDTYEYHEDGRNTLVTLHCDSLMRILDERYILAPAIYDGWNHYAAMHYLASYAGFTDAQIGWSGLVDSSDPTKIISNGTETGYTLPIEFGNRTWSLSYRSLSVRQAMSEIQKVTGYLLYVDELGVLQYKAWIPASDQHSAVRRVFRKMPSDSYEVLPTEIQNLDVYVTNRDVRNNIAVIGINASYEGAVGDQSWQPIVVIAEDQPSQGAEGVKPYNYVGYRKDHVLKDARFANVDFARDTAVRLYNLERQPTMQVSFRTAFLQPDLFPLMYVMVETDKNIPFLNNTPLVIWKVSHHIDTTHGAGFSEITARYVAPFQNLETLNPIIY